MKPRKKTLYSEIKGILEEARNSAVRAVNFSMVLTYWEIGRLIVEEEQKGKSRAGYGDMIIEELSDKLSAEFGSGYSITSLKNFRQFFKAFPQDRKSSALRSQLSWTHYRLLMRVVSKEARHYYLEESISQNWSSRVLERQINSLYYERLLSSKNRKALVKKSSLEASKDKPTILDFVKDPYVLEFLSLKPNSTLYEKELETELINKLQLFMLELGKGFSFVERQKRISADGEHFYVDLVFYNYILKCFVLIDLKVGKLTHQDIGQMDLYVRYFEEEIKQSSDNPTIGIILCTEKNETVVKYSVLKESKQLFATKYKLHLPSEKELIAEVNFELSQLKKRKLK
ncbi:MAG: putative cytoplasmic protein [Bacteroidetes bacterium]|jgi:predicted nuclease of restriction endonuclease-like (RecB) superfamily|nr:putative cytoplasmic protein [Bacteroidota bacterium]